LKLRVDGAREEKTPPRVETLSFGEALGSIRQRCIQIAERQVQRLLS